jgi:hypothetical protein
MALSNKTIENLAETLVPEVIDYIISDERWIDFMNEMVPDAIDDKLGNVDDNLKFDLAMSIIDRISFKIAT